MSEHAAFVARDGTPLSVLWALPFRADERAVAREWNPEHVRAELNVWPTGVAFLDHVGRREALLRARLPTVAAFALLLLWVVYAGVKVWGSSGAFAASFLVASSPALLSHAGLVSPDLLASLAAFAFCWAAYRFQREGGGVAFALVAVTGALAIASKLTCLAIVVAATFAWLIPSDRNLRRVAWGFVALALAVVLADLIYRLAGSSLIEPITASRTLARTKFDVFFLGDLRDPGREFYAVLFASKMTPLFLAALVASAIHVVVKRSQASRLVEGWVGFGLPACALIGAMSVTDYPQGFRFLLPAVPLLAFAIAPTIQALIESRRRWVTGVVALAFAAQCADTLRAHPHHLAYWNEFVGGMDDGSWIAVDSNCDWGQAQDALESYATDHGVEHVFALSSQVAAPLDARHQALPALGAALARGESLSSSVIAVSVTFARIATHATNDFEPLHAFVHELTRIPPHAAPGHAIHVWHFTPEVEALAREHLGKYLQR
ncbi:MAG: glycosyltransferase family 39 protein [Planctomycetes bacterium]|nr:glycosyltransferase family 39 protein [Planctomycetota bacterium]